MRKLSRRSGKSCAAGVTISNRRPVPAAWTPSWARSAHEATLRTHEVAIFAGAAFLVVAAKGKHLEIAVTTGDTVTIWPTPWIDQCLWALEIGSTPSRDAGGRLYQR